MSNHTPGPWHIETVTCVADEDRIEVASVRDWGGDPDITLATTRLIAAAPDLLALLQRGLECGIFDDAPVHKQDVRALLTKAEGRGVES